MKFPFLRRNRHQNHQLKIDESPLSIKSECDEKIHSRDHVRSAQPNSKLVCTFDGGYEVTSSQSLVSNNPIRIPIRNGTLGVEKIADVTRPRFVHELDDIPSPPRVNRKHIENRMEELAELDRFVFSSWQLSDTSTESYDIPVANTNNSTCTRVKDLSKGSVMIKVMSLDSQSNAMSTIAEIVPNSPSAPSRAMNKIKPSQKLATPNCDLSATTVSSSTSILENSSTDDDYGDDDEDDDYFSFGGYEKGRDGSINFANGCIRPCEIVASDSLFLLEEIIRAATTPDKKGKDAR